MSLFHVAFDRKTDEQIAHAPLYKLEAVKRDLSIDSLQQLFSNNAITKDHYLSQYVVTKNHYKKNLKKLSGKRKYLARLQSFRGRSSFHFWLAQFGIISLAFYFCCKSLYSDFVTGSTYRHQLVSISGIIVCLFWYVHLIFLTQKDFNGNKYIGILILCAVLSSVFIYYLVKHYTYKDDIILKQLSFIERIRTIHYPAIAVKAKFAEKYDKGLISENKVEDEIKEFQYDLTDSTKH
ncbi:MAG: hypothetical protein COA88_15770 [Kordia sp.]|nr:MAG: hypothetical protein COA88_15770 [Kordia sp.]